jgi:hypothetical protein
MIFYSQSTKGFYNTEIHGNSIPGDCVTVTEAEYKRLFDGVAQGKFIVPDSDGNPIIVDPPTESVESIIQNNKLKRQHAYTTESDPLFFKSQRGEVTLQEWKDKVEEIKARFP